MRKSTIHKHRRVGAGGPLARGIGRELRRRRVAAGMTQATLGDPLTRAFVSAVERGRTIPSLAALALFADRLGTSLDEFFSGVQSEMTPTYTSAHERSSNPSTGDRR